MKVQLTVLLGPEEGRTFDLAEGPSVFGRGDEGGCSLQGDPTLSRRHFRVVLEQETLLLEDLGSRSGTSVNDRPVEAGGIGLRPGDRITCGQSVLLVSDADPPVTTDPPRCRRCGLADPAGAAPAGEPLIVFCPACRQESWIIRRSPPATT